MEVYEMLYTQDHNHRAFEVMQWKWAKQQSSHASYMVDFILVINMSDPIHVNCARAFDCLVDRVEVVSSKIHLYNYMCVLCWSCDLCYHCKGPMTLPDYDTAFITTVQFCISTLVHMSQLFTIFGNFVVSKNWQNVECIFTDWDANSINTVKKGMVCWQCQNPNTHTQFWWHWSATFWAVSSLVPSCRPKEEEEKRPGFSRSRMHCHGGIPPPPHAIDILPYACDAWIDTKRNTVHRFMIAKKLTWFVLIQRPIWSYKQTVRASVKSADEKKRLPTGKTIARSNLGFHCTSVCSFC